MANNPPHQLAHQVSEGPKNVRSPESFARMKDFEEWKGDKTLEECVKELHETVHTICLYSLEVGDNADKNERGVLSLFRVIHEMKQALKGAAIGGSPDDAIENEDIYNYGTSALQVAKRETSRLAYSLLNPPPATDMKQAKLLRDRENKQTFRLIMDGDLTEVVLGEHSEESESEMSIDGNDGEE